MKQLDVLKKIGALIQDLNEQYEYILTYGDSIDDVEIELFVANTHFIAEHAEILRKLNNQSLAIAKAIKPIALPESFPEQKPEKFFEPMVQQVSPPAEDKPEIAPFNGIHIPEVSSIPIELEIPKPKELPVPEVSFDLLEDADQETHSLTEPEPEPEVIRHELTLDDLGDWDEDEDEIPAKEEQVDESYNARIRQPIITPPTVVEALVTPPVAIEPAAIAPPVIAQPVISAPVVTPPPAVIPLITKPAPAPEEEHLTLNQRMSAQLNASSRVSDSLSAQPISDLKSAISLNEKLLFIKDLFNGYSLAYSEAIELLNRYQTLDEADKFLKSHYYTKNKWEEKESTVEKLYAILRRKYM